MDLAPFKLDIDELLDDYAKENCMSFTDFKRVWMAKKFSYIYEGRPKANSGVFMQSLFLHCIGHMTSQSSLLQRLPGLYCLYCLYECQPYKPHYKIYLSLEESNKLKDFVIEAKQNGLSLVPALVKRMLDKGMFLFGFINLLGDNEAKEVDEMNASQNKRVKFACDKYVDFLLYHLSCLIFIISICVFFLQGSKLFPWLYSLYADKNTLPITY
ncbi:unnamed protein product [Triticum turgidum subsp. durum]|uniref:snRNA-activating protein complex subunit 1 n=1 Tax=Triticum turgidum subsp. durum TaxID=4567 RepID=A0A9R0X0C3_TRITD|nr:unnamed protein product [Triticum turgidum subsp. durum]